MHWWVHHVSLGEVTAARVAASRKVGKNVTVTGWGADPRYLFVADNQRSKGWDFVYLMFMDKQNTFSNISPSRVTFWRFILEADF